MLVSKQWKLQTFLTIRTGHHIWCVYAVGHQKGDDNESGVIVPPIFKLLLRSMTHRFANPCELGLHVGEKYKRRRGLTIPLNHVKAFMVG